jgi:hypothetical protein
MCRPCHGHPTPERERLTSALCSCLEAAARRAVVRLLGALLPVVKGGSAEPTGDALALTANAGVRRCPACRPLTGHFIGPVLQDTRQRAAVKRDDLQAQRLQRSRYAMVS